MKHMQRPRGDRGAVTAQLVVVVPMLLILALMVVQVALAWHARHIAQYATETALAAARVKDGSASDGRAQGRRSLAQLGSQVLTSPSVTVRRTSTHVTAHVKGVVMPVLPGLHLTTTGTASGAVERITTPTGQRP